MILSPRRAAHDVGRRLEPTAGNTPICRDNIQQEGIKPKLSEVFAANYRHYSDTFPGALDENWSRFLTTYQQVCSETVFKAGDKIQFLRHALRDKVPDFYYNQILDRQTNWRSAVSMLNEAYSSEAIMDALTENSNQSQFRTTRWRRKLKEKR